MPIGQFDCDHNAMKCQRVAGGRCAALQRLSRPVTRAVRRAVTKAVAEPEALVTPFESTSTHLEQWSPTSWRNYTALQQPAYPDKASAL